MAKRAIATHTEMIRLSGVSWQTYESLLDELRDRRFRLSFNRGDLELMAPSPENELSKKMQVSELVIFLNQAETMDYLQVIQSFRTWVQSQLAKEH